MAEAPLPERAPSAPDALAAQRAGAVAATLDDIRAAVGDGAPDRTRLEAVRDRLVRLAAERSLFPPAAFPAPEAGERVGSCLYRLSQDDDDRFALYLNACRDTTDTPPHDHTTWAVVVGFSGEELNRFYRHTPPAEGAPEGGVEETRSAVVAEGCGVTLLPDDLHSIHIRGGGLNFHLYGLALERLDGRRYFRAEDATWHTFPAHRDIREARAGRVPAAAS
jgi:predicted metal-dependent enzyme (double-stranded beta helix superfamily)